MVALESVIWKAIFDIARGQIDVYAAAQVISDAIPGILQDAAPEDKYWFHLGSFSIYLPLLICINYLHR